MFLGTHWLAVTLRYKKEWIENIHSNIKGYTQINIKQRLFLNTSLVYILILHAMTATN